MFKRGYKNLNNPLYLNANIIYSEALNYIKKPNWKRNIKTGTIPKLKREGYGLVTSILTRMEVLQRLCSEENLNSQKAREIFHSIINDHKILEITAIDEHIKLNDAYIDKIGTSNLDFKDALHLTIAQKLDMPVCTHDKKARGNFSQHEEKSKFHNQVFKPQELIKPRK